jgi:hypothetical protein
MPVLEGPVNKPEKVSMMPPMGDMPGPGGPEGPGGPGGPEGPGGPDLPPGQGPADLNPHPPTCRPSEHPGSVPGADVEPGMPGPGFPGGGPPKSPPFPRMDSIDVLNGQLYVAAQPYAEIKGSITATAMEDASYVTDEVCLNGLYIGGDSEYTIANSRFDLTGYGIDDFAGNGSAVMLNNTAKCEMDNVQITTHGVIRPCTTATGNSTLIVRNCVLDSRGGEIPATYVPRVASGMMQPPPGLNLGGNCRTHLSMGNSKCYFYDSKIIAHSWAALSTDSSAGDLYLEANNCDVVCETVGYGTYADNGCHNVLNNCRIDVDTHVAIIAGDAWVKLNDCTVKSNQYGCMLHGVRGHYTEVTEGHIVGGDWTVGDALFFVKSENVYLKLDGTKVKAKYLIHSILNDDDAHTVVPEDMVCKVYGVNAVIANGQYEGDIVHEDPDRTCNVSLVNAALKGVITDAYVGLENSTWFATGDSAVCLMGDVQPAAIDAPAGVTVTAKAGDGCALAGDYVLASGGKLIVA